MFFYEKPCDRIVTEQDMKKFNKGFMLWHWFLWLKETKMLYFSFFLIFYIYLLISVRERKGDGERNINRLPPTCTSVRPNPQPWYVPWLGIEPVTFLSTGWCSNQVTHTSLAISLLKLFSSEHLSLLLSMFNVYIKVRLNMKHIFH